jgi:hypothetical protein
MKSDRPSDLTTLLAAFQHLSPIDNPIQFHVEFEKQQKASGLRLGTFKAAWKSWKTQQGEGGEAQC